MEKPFLVKIDETEELFNKWMEFESKFGFNTCQLTALVQNEGIEIPMEDLIVQLKYMKKIVKNRAIDMEYEFKKLMELTIQNILNNNPILKSY